MNKNFLPAPQEKERAVQAMFSSIARYYDLNNTLLSLGLHHLWKKKTIQCAGLRPGDRILDVGSGTADLARLAMRYVGDDGLVIASDLNEPMLKIGLDKLDQAASSSRAIFSCLRANAESLPIKEQSIDIVLTGFCLRNVADLDRALLEIFRVLKPGGRMVCLEFSRPTHPFLRMIYGFYSFTLLPLIGKWVSRDQTGVYQYLPASIRRFPDQETFSQKLREIGFNKVSYINQTGGIIAIHIAEK